MCASVCADLSLSLSLTPPPASQTKLLLRVLEELVQSHRADDYLPKNNAHKLETLRLALARNLARAIVLAPAASVAGEAP